MLTRQYHDKFIAIIGAVTTYKSEGIKENIKSVNIGNYVKGYKVHICYMAFIKVNDAINIILNQ